MAVSFTAMAKIDGQKLKLDKGSRKNKFEQNVFTVNCILLLLEHFYIVLFLYRETIKT